MRIQKALVPIIFIFLLFSCEDMGLFSGNETTAEIITPEDGIILDAEDEIPIELFFENETPSSFSITLIDGQGDIRGTTTLDEEEVLLDIPPLVLPEDLEDGFYRLNLELFSGEETLTSRIMPFFLINDQPRIQEILSYPFVFYTGGEGLAFLDAYLPLELEPWVRWSFEGDVIKQGPLAEGLGQVKVTAPDVPGFYTLAVEIVPMLPPEGESEWSFTSPMRKETLISVSEDIQFSGSLPLDSGSFYSLFHFQGEYNDWGDRDRPLSFSAGNNPEIDLTRGIFGYRMNAYSTFRSEGFLFPVSPERRLQPFSLYMNFALDETPAECRILQSSLNGFDFLVEMDISGIPVVSLKGSDNEVQLPLDDPLDPGVYTAIISVYPDPEHNRLSLSWYHEGVYAETSVEGWYPGELWGEADFEVESETILSGGASGFGVLDELGVYYLDIDGQNSVKTNLFAKNAQNIYENQLEYADGFDSLYLNEELSLLEPYNTGEYEVMFGRLALESDSVVQLYGAELENGLLTLALAMMEMDREEDSCWLQFRQETDEGLVLLGEVPVVPGEGETILSIVKSEGMLTVGNTVFQLVTEVQKEGGGTLSVSPSSFVYIGLSNRGENTLYLDDVLILSEPMPAMDNLLLEYPSEL